MMKDVELMSSGSVCFFMKLIYLEILVAFRSFSMVG